MFGHPLLEEAMASTSSSITIRRPIDDVFAVLTDVENAGSWFPGDVREHWTSPPPHGLGSTRRAVVRMLGRTTENDAVTTAYEPPYLAAMQGTSPNAPFLATLRFASEGDGTRVDARIDFPMLGAARLVGPPFAWLYGMAWRRGMQNLKRMMESGEL
jgi:carbon monoxide dehydrogenase subunit G